MSRIGFIGTGHIAAPMARHLASKGHEIWVTERNRKVSAELVREVGARVGEAQAVLDACEIVFLCLRPHVAAEVLRPLNFRASHHVVSVMAGISEAVLGDLCAPASDFVQTIPLGFLESGGCPLASYGNTDLLTALFSPENPVIPVSSEAALNAHFAICALVPGMLDLLHGAGHWLGERTGDPAASEYFTAQLLSGFLAAMQRDAPGVLACERDALATEGTISLMMVEGVRAAGVPEAIRDQLTAIETRLKGAGL